jgi:hypothetical protein
MKRRTRDEIEAFIEETCPDTPLLLADGLEPAFLGLVQTFEQDGIRVRALYSLRRCVEVLVEDGSSEQSALEFLEYNTLGAYAGPETPSFLLDLEEL